MDTDTDNTALHQTRLAEAITGRRPDLFASHVVASARAILNRIRAGKPVPDPLPPAVATVLAVLDWASRDLEVIATISNIAQSRACRPSRVTLPVVDDDEVDDPHAVLHESNPTGGAL